MARLSFLLLLACAWSVQADVSKGWQAYREQRWQAAEQALAGVRTWRAQMAAGTAAYQRKHWARAMRYFRQASWWALSDRQRAQALYNLGLSFIQLEQYAKAVETFSAALRYQADFPDAQRNLKAAEHLLSLQGRFVQKSVSERKKTDDNFAFAGGRKPVVTDDARGEWDNQIVRQRKQGSRWLNQKAEASTDKAYIPLAQIEGITRLSSLEKSQRVERFVQQLSRLSDSQWLLQRRLFEREEGFEAAQKMPHNIKGAAPW